MEFRILGPLEVAEGGVALPLGAPKDRALLALLLLSAGEVVSNDRLVDALWGEEPPRTAAGSIQNSISQLRKLLGGRVVTRPPGYSLELWHEDELDVDRARTLVERARAAGREAAVELLREAEALWRGLPLADFEYEAFAQTEISRLDQLRLTVVEERIGHELELGRHADAVGELEALVARYPLHENLRAHLMLALYRAARQADALQSYQDACEQLRRQLGVDPGHALRRLHSAIIRQDRSLDRPSSTAAATARVDDVARALRTGQLIPILGTEVGELARTLAERFAFRDSGKLTRVAQYVALMSGSGPLRDELHDLLAPVTPTPVHRFLAALPPLFRELGVPHQLVVTTSYDLALEQAFLEAGEEFDVVSYLSNDRNRGKFCHFAPDGEVRLIDVPNRYATELSLERRTVILKLHGGVDPAHERAWESFVVTEDDYIDYLPHGDLARAIPVGLSARLRRSHFLLLGYGVLDWNLRVLLHRLWGTEGTDYRSWAVALDPDPIERALWRTRDVELLEAPLDGFVDSLAYCVGLGGEAVG